MCAYFFISILHQPLVLQWGHTSIYSSSECSVIITLGHLIWNSLVQFLHLKLCDAIRIDSATITIAAANGTNTAKKISILTSFKFNETECKSVHPIVLAVNSLWFLRYQIAISLLENFNQEFLISEKQSSNRFLLNIMNLCSSPLVIRNVAIGKMIHFHESSQISLIGKTRFLYFLSTVSLFVLYVIPLSST